MNTNPSPSGTCAHVWAIINRKTIHETTLVECIHCGERTRA